jgi:hypothetical protein
MGVMVMGRAPKKSVDYFPHMCAHGKTLGILEARYKNDGYAFWFKLLEELGKTAGHYLDCNNSGTIEWIQAKTQSTPERTNEILDLLATLQAIDEDLWKEKIIWSQNFVDNLTPVYSNRGTPLPPKPTIGKKDTKK